MDHCARPLTGQLRELACAALREQGIVVRRLRWMGQHTNHQFRCDTAAGERLVVRVCLPGGRSNAELDAELARRPIDPAVRRILTETAGRVEAMLARLGQDRAGYGLVHADLDLDNVLDHHGQAHLIDFDDASWGHYALDLAIAAGSIPETLRPALLGGYQTWGAWPASARRRPVTTTVGAGSHLRRDRRTMECGWVRAQAGGRMNRIRRRVSAAVNPVSTAATRWWCHSALRHMLTGYGPTARQRRFIRHGTPLIRHGTQGGGFAPSAEQRAEQMKARARAIDDLLGRDDHEM